MVFDLLFGKGRKKTPDPDINFGRYSDNNKSVAKVNRWAEAESLFKQNDHLGQPRCFFRLPAR